MEDTSITPPEFYRVRPARAVAAADKLIKLKKENKPWEAIELIVDIWKTTRPKEYKSYIVQVDDAKETLADPKYGKSRNSNLRRTLDVPEMVLNMIRKLYSPEELPMNKEFFIAWSKKFPKMMIAEKF